MPTPAPTSPVDLAQNAKVLKKTETIADATAKGEWVAEPKLDGWRALIHVADDGVHVFSRSAKRYDGSVPHVEEALERLPAGTWLDGELVVFTDEQDRHSWGSVQSIMGSSTERAASMSHVMTFVAFDVISFAGQDSRGLPFEARRDFLIEMFTGFQLPREAVRLVEQDLPSEEYLQECIERGYEGIILKDLAAPYSSGKRGHGQRKVKPQETVDGFVVGYKEGKDSFAGMIGALIVGAYDESGEVVPILRCSGMTMAVRQEITENRDEWMGRVVEVKCHRVDGGIRHPQFNRVRDDKSSRDCTTEEV